MPKRGEIDQVRCTPGEFVPKALQERQKRWFIVCGGRSLGSFLTAHPPFHSHERSKANGVGISPIGGRLQTNKSVLRFFGVSLQKSWWATLEKLWATLRKQPRLHRPTGADAPTDSVHLGKWQAPRWIAHEETITSLVQIFLSEQNGAPCGARETGGEGHSRRGWVGPTEPVFRGNTGFDPISLDFRKFKDCSGMPARRTYLSRV